VLKSAEKEKKRAYNDRIIEVQNGTFTPLHGIWDKWSNGCMMNARHFINSQIKDPRMMNWIRTRLNFSIMRSALLCLGGTRVIFNALVT
jgi:hypothetical protein